MKKITVSRLVKTFGSKKAAAEALQVSRQALWLWENGRNGVIPYPYDHVALKLLTEAERGSEG